MHSIEFGSLDFERGFEPVPGKPKVSVKVLSDTLDHDTRTGLRTRLIKVESNYHNDAHDHPYWEELVILSGSLIEIDPAADETRHETHAHSRRAPGHSHGPVRTDETCCLFEVNWYDADEARSSRLGR